MILTPYDLETELWKKIYKHYETLLASTQRELEKNLTPEQTAACRGRARLLRQLMNTEDKNNVRVN